MMNIKDLFYKLLQPHHHKGYHFSVVEQLPEEECLTGERAFVVIMPLKKEGAYPNTFVAPFQYRVRFQVWSMSAALSDEIAGEVLRRLSGCSSYWQPRELILTPAMLDSALRAWVSVAQVEGLAHG